MNRRGLIVVLSGPSGAGKGTLLKAACQKNSNIRLSVSATTRKPRENEIDGVNYFFKTVEEFRQMIRDGDLVEWVQYCGNYYGTPARHIEELTAKGYDVILEIEVEGALNIKGRYPDCVSVFVIPPSLEELERRIVGRGTETAEAIQKRLKRARMELKIIDNYDYVVLNDNIETAADDINCILHTEKLKYFRNREFVEEMLGNV